MRRVAVLTLLLITTSGLSGCMDTDTFDDLWTDLEARDRFEERQLLDENQTFSTTGALDPTNPPGSEEDLGDRWSTNVTIPSGTRSMTVLFNINFTEPEAPETPLPQPNPPSGDVRIFVRGPAGDNETQNLSAEESGSFGFDFRRPSEGDWEIGYRARGEGSITVSLFATVPVNRTAST